MPAKKQAKVILSKAITFNCPERGAVSLNAGVNTVDADIAEHWFVKAHSLDRDPNVATASDGAELVALRTENETLKAKNAELQAIVDALDPTKATATGGKK